MGLSVHTNHKGETVARLTRNALPAPLRPEDIRNTAQVVTVMETHVDVPAPNTRSGKTTYMVLREYPGKGFYLSEADKDVLIEAFGTDDTDAFTGQGIPVHIREQDNWKADKNPTEPRTLRFVRVAPVAMWREDFALEIPKKTRKARK